MVIRKNSTSGVYAALLRGINVSGKNKLAMRLLVEIFEDAGCVDVRTYIQSGNVIFRVGRKVAGRLPDLVAGEIAGRFGYRTPVVLRTAGELARIASENPFLPDGVDTKHLHVGFLSSKPSPAAVRRLDPDRSPPDAFSVRGREIYLCCPNGMARTKLTNHYLDSTLGTTSTVRNWRTVLRLVELADSIA